MKIDTHRHMGGSINTRWVWETIQKLGLKHLAETSQDVIDQMTFAPQEARNFHRFLDKFRILDGIPWTLELIDSSIQSLCSDLEAEQTDYTWLDLSINKYMCTGLHKWEVIKFIHDCFERYRPGQVGLILSLKYESMRASQRQYARLIEHEQAARCLVGIDLVGDEAYFDADFYAPIFADWRVARKICRTHAGESQSCRNIAESIERLGVTNVAHGFKILEDPSLVSLARERHITFDLALTSNYITGVLGSGEPHPGVRMLDAGLRCTLGSDDPVQCSTTLDREFEIAGKFGFTDCHLDRMRQVAVENSVGLSGQLFL